VYRARSSWVHDGVMIGRHAEHEDFPWTIAVVEHPARTDSPGYRASRQLMKKLAATVPEWIFGAGPFEDHHGGGLWVKDDTGWLCLTLPLGIEWSAQFCADPAKVDRLRQVTARVVAGFPATLPGYVQAGYTSGEEILTTPITTADQVAAWTDSIFNASLPLPVRTHTGVLPTGAGYHHYPKPIVDIDHCRYDDFQPFVTDPGGQPAVVVPGRTARLRRWSRPAPRSPARLPLRGPTPPPPNAGTPLPECRAGRRTTNPACARRLSRGRRSSRATGLCPPTVRDAAECQLREDQPPADLWQGQGHPAAFDEVMPKTLATATVERLLHHAHVCQTTGDSIGLTQALTCQGVSPMT
jgi:hypothetical protein